MAQMVDRIGNRWFGEQLQFYLHEWGKHTLGDLRFTNQGVNNYRNYKAQLEYPQTAMPENIKFFKYFQIEHFDNRVFNFFRRIQSVLTADTKLMIHFHFKSERALPKDYDSHIDPNPKEVAEQLGNARTILGHLLPLIDGVHTLYTDDRMMSLLKPCMRGKFHKVKVFDVTFHRPAQAAMKPTMEWLTANSNENEPKLFQLDAKNCIAKKQFMEATKAATFAVIFLYDCDFPAFHCENSIGEQLSGIRNEKADGAFTVFRNHANAKARDKLRQWLKENTDGDGCYNFYNPKQYINLCKPTIGPGSIFAVHNLDEADETEEKEGAEDDKPSTSKKRRTCK